MNEEIITPEIKMEILRRFKEEIVRKAKRLAPIDTGFLRAHIKGEVNSPEEITIFTEGVDYASYLEDGTIYIESGTPENPREFKNKDGNPKGTYTPFIRPAIYRTIPQISNIVKSVLEGKP